MALPKSSSAADHKDILVGEIDQTWHHLGTERLRPLADFDQLIVLGEHEFLQPCRLTLLSECEDAVVNLHGVAVLEIEALVDHFDQLVCLFLVLEEGRLVFVAAVPGEVRGWRDGKLNLRMLHR